MTLSTFCECEGEFAIYKIIGTQFGRDRVLCSECTRTTVGTDEWREAINIETGQRIINPVWEACRDIER